mgnify:CR=1 FL=1
MKSRITVTLPRKLRKEIVRLSRTSGVSPSAIVRESLQDYLFLRRFRSLRMKLIPLASRKQIFTDDDVFERIS